MFVAHILHVICGTWFQAVPVTCGRRLKLSVEDLVFRKFHENIPHKVLQPRKRKGPRRWFFKSKISATKSAEPPELSLDFNSGELSWVLFDSSYTTLWRKNTSLFEASLQMLFCSYSLDWGRKKITHFLHFGTFVLDSTIVLTCLPHAIYH